MWIGQKRYGCFQCGGKKVNNFVKIGKKWERELFIYLIKEIIQRDKEREKGWGEERGWGKVMVGVLCFRNEEDREEVV